MTLVIHALLPLAGNLTPIVASVLHDPATDAINKSIDNLIHLAQLVTGAVCAGMLCVGGFNYATSSGNPIKMERARHTLAMAGVGIAIVLLSVVLGTAIHNAIVVPSSGS